MQTLRNAIDIDDMLAVIGLVLVISRKKFFNEQVNGIRFDMHYTDFQMFGAYNRNCCITAHDNTIWVEN